MSQAGSLVLHRPSLEASEPPWSDDARFFALLLLLVYTSVTCFYGLRGGPPLGDHECINAFSARNVLESGEWLIPSLGDAPRIRKTPLGIWAIAAATAATGEKTELGPVTPFSARLPSALAAFGTVAVTYWLGAMLFGFRAGLVAGFIAAGAVATIMYARNAQVDMLLTFFTTTALALFWRGGAHPQPSRWAMRLFYLAFSLAMLAKAPLPLATIGLSLFVYWFITVPLYSTFSTNFTFPPEGAFARVLRSIREQTKRLGTLWVIPGVVLFVVLVGAWPIYVYAKMDNALALWRIEYLSRYSGELSSKPVWYYIPIVFGLTIPYMLSLPEAVAAPFLPRYSVQRRGLLYAFTVALVGTAFLSSAAFKRPHYLLSLFPVFCLLLAPVVDRLFFGYVTAGRRTVMGACVALAVGLTLAAAAGGIVVSREYPALLRTYFFVAAAALVLWIAACWAYARDRRTSSFALLNLGLPVVLFLAWPALEKGAGLNAEADALAHELKARGIATDRPLYWVEGQASYVLPFYHGIKVQRLIDEIEMAGLREGRRQVSEDVYVETVRRIQERMRADPAAHFAVSAQYFDLLSRRTDLTVKEVVRLQGFHADPADEVVVFARAVDTG